VRTAPHAAPTTASNSATGKDYDVKSYASTVLGRCWGWKVFSFVRRTNTTRGTLNLDDFTQVLVRRKLLSDDK
jgi:hypothetical protein